MNETGRWCVVMADTPGPAWGVVRSSRVLPVQFARVSEASTPYQSALLRATSLAPAPQVLITVGAEHRSDWEAASWFVRPQRRCVGESSSLAPLTLATALLAVARQNESHRIIVLPAGALVARDRVLKRALEVVLEALPDVPEGIASLGMVEREDAIDEDYLLVMRPRAGRGLTVRSLARRPLPWVARHLKDQGALIASGILVGYAGAFAAHLAKGWPTLTRRLSELASDAAAAGRECRIGSETLRGVAPVDLKALCWLPRALPQRIFAVVDSGWCGLKTPRAISHQVRFHASARRWAHEERSAAASAADQAAAVCAGASDKLTSPRIGGTTKQYMPTRENISAAPAQPAAKASTAIAMRDSRSSTTRRESRST